MSHQPRSVAVTVFGEGFDSDFALKCLQSAQSSRVRGWIRCDDNQSTAHLHLEGLSAQVDSFLAWLRGGVAGARISRIDVDVASRETWDEFEILD